MEVAGLVLGGIPIALAALDGYKRCLRVTKDVVKYEATLKTFRIHVFIQKKQLEVTLGNIGLHTDDGRLPTKAELNEHLEKLYRIDECEKFLEILAEMEEIVNKLLEKLDVDSQGKPQWTTEPPERASWEWRRVRRGLNSSARDELIQQLQYWNTALSKVFEKPEITPDEDGLLVQKIQTQFNGKKCNAIRNNIRCTYGALAQTWRCSCPEHAGHLSLSWHTGQAASSASFDSLTLTVATHDGSWVSLNAKVEQQSPVVGSKAQTPTQAQPRLAGPEPSSKPLPNKRKKLWLLLSRGNRKSANQIAPAAASTPPPPAPAASAAPAWPVISCLCNFINLDSRPKQGVVSFINERNTSIMNRLALYFQPPPQPTGDPTAKYHPLDTFLSPETLAGREEAGAFSTTGQLSRKERFATAAAAAWAVLYLYGTPWLEDDWPGTSTISLVKSLSAARPAISCALKPQSAQRPPHSISELAPERLQNPVLFALGVLLTELCLNTTLGSMRHQKQGHSLVGDYELANRQSDRVYLEAGQSYGYAVQRCLRCEFPGRDTTKSLEFEQFREMFFKTVVAPVQAVYEMQCR